jgi:SAM-dependent methyltransferase
MTAGRKDTWASGELYEPYVGRWSRLVAQGFLAWLAVPPERSWLDVGCGIGALMQTILATAAPDRVVGVDPSADYIAYAREHVRDARVRFDVSDAQRLPFDAATFDAVVSGLVLNFVPNSEQAVTEMKRVARPGGIVAAYVWDYAGDMQLMRFFWDAAVALNPAAADLDEGRRFPLCKSEPLAQLFTVANLREVAVRAVDVPTHFRGFDDYWTPFLGGQGPAPGYAMSLAEEQRTALREQIRRALPIEPDGSIRLIARAWAVRGICG